MPTNPSYIKAPDLGALPMFAHGFFGRLGGVSPAPYDSLNAGFYSDDTHDNVIENNARAMRALGFAPSARVGLKQIHSNICHTVSAPWPAHAPEGDALVTNQKGLMLGVLSADCAPALFADATARVVGAAHAGWGGALGGVLEATIDAMCALGATKANIVAAIGPCIGAASYEVSKGFEAPFLAEDSASATCFAPGQNAGKLMFDLPAYVRLRLLRAGLANPYLVGVDTYASPQAYFSHRYATLHGNGKRGLQVSLIGIK